MEYKTYSVKQIAYLYLLDPVGIEYYMRNHACHDKDIMSGEFLSYKDEVYEAIFGNSERLSGRFYFTIVDGSVRYGRYSGAKRMDVYSNAEIIFGSHTIFNWSSFWQSIGEPIFENIPVISHILLGVEIYQALFYSGSIVSAMSGVASEFLDDYATVIEEASRKRFIYAYEEQSSFSTVDFFKRAIGFFGYAPGILQTDNGAEFTHLSKTNRIHPLDVFCNRYRIQHKLIRPRTPWHNGKVERSHRNDQERFYNHIFYSYRDLQKQMERYLYRSNNIPMSILGWKSPNEMHRKLGVR